MDSGVTGIGPRPVLVTAAVLLLVFDIALLGWGRSVDLRPLLRGLHLAPPYSAREFFGIRMAFAGVAVAAVSVATGVLPLAVLALAIGLLCLLVGLAYQEQAERSGVALEERRARDEYRARVRAMSKRERMRERLWLAGVIVLGGGVIAAFRLLT